MTQALWTEVDQYFIDLFHETDPVLTEALRAAEEAGLPHIQVTPNQGKLLAILVQALGARKVLEIGTLGAYSTIWMGRALPPGGKLITLEANQDHAAVARANLERAGLSNVVEVRLGRAIDTLPRLAEEGIAPFDFIFIDADKPSSTAYFEWALRLSHPGSLIVVDNVVRKGEIINASSEDPNVQGMRASFDVMAGEPRVTSTVLQMVSGKGYDGMAFSLVL